MNTDNINVQDNFNIEISQNDNVIEQPDINKNNNIINTPLNYTKSEETISNPPSDKNIIEDINTPKNDVILETSNIPYIKTDFKTNTTQIRYTVLGTQDKDKIMAVNKKITMIHGRGYLIPVNDESLNSDNYSCIKIYSHYSYKMDIRYVKDGYAFVIPLMNNISINTNQVIGVLI